ncbi:MAG: hypothetical protein Q9172_007803 [Xanthocarpia lactea]
MDLYMSQEEWTVLQFVTLTWSCFQCWDLSWDFYYKRTRLMDSQGEKALSIVEDGKRNALSATASSCPGEPADAGHRGDGMRSHTLFGPDIQRCIADQRPSSIQQYKEAMASIGSKDDASRFVGLGQLKVILESNTELCQVLRRTTAALAECWAAISGRFLDRLLTAVDYEGDQVVDRGYSTNLAVSIIHTFVQLLPKSSRNDKKFAKRVDKLLAVLEFDIVLSETKKQVLEILDALADTPHGSTALLTSKNWPALLQSTVPRPITASIDRNTYRNAFTYKTAQDLLTVQPELHQRISDWIFVLRHTPDATALFEHVLNLVRWHVPQLETSDAPEWLAPLTQRLLESTGIAYTDAARSRMAIVQLSAVLVRCYPTQFLNLLYGSQLLDKSTSEPAAWIFLQHRLIEISSSIPHLLELPDVKYMPTMMLLACCYELVSALTYFLVERPAASSGEIDGFEAESSTAKSEADGGSDKLPFNPDLLLKLREDVSTICSLTIEYLRDRFEVSMATKTLCPTRSGMVSATECLGFFSTDVGPPTMVEDPLLRMLSLWLREDEGVVLRTEAANSMIDVVLGLYGMAEHLRSPLLMILEQCQYAPDGLDRIRVSHGWNALVSDLESIARSRAPDDYVIHCGIIIIDILGPVAGMAVAGGTDKDEWKQFARIATQLDAEGSADLLDLKAAVAMLAIDLLRENQRPSSGGSAQLRKKLFAVPSRLLAARNRMKEATVEDLDATVEAIGRAMV